MLSATSANDATRLWLRDASLHQSAKTTHVEKDDSANVWDEDTEDMEGEEDEEGGEVVTAPVLAGRKRKFLVQKGSYFVFEFTLLA